jgi:peptide-methionine (S)-S-oxide reductase
VSCPLQSDLADRADAEAVQLEFDPARISYRQLLDFFYRMHDPTTAGAQGGDVGSQYRSAIFHHTAEQEREAREVTNLVNAQWFGGRVTTELLPAGSWWEAEAYHQRHLDVNPGGYHCSAHFKRAFPPLSS